MMESEKLIEIARQMMQRAYAPYSNFKVGAVLVTKSGKIYGGCNIENSSYGLTVCAERVAIFSAVANGEKDFSKMVVIANTPDPVSPCGACRQVMAEFGNFEVILANTSGKVYVTTVENLLPHAFKLRGEQG